MLWIRSARTQGWIDFADHRKDRRRHFACHTAVALHTADCRILALAEAIPGCVVVASRMTDSDHSQGDCYSRPLLAVVVRFADSAGSQARILQYIRHKPDCHSRLALAPNLCILTNCLHGQGRWIAHQ